MTQSTDEFRRETRVAIDAVKRALAIARRGIGAGDITAKGGRDLVTVTDVAVEDAVRGMVADALAELGVEHIELPATSERVWHAIQDAGRQR